MSITDDLLPDLCKARVFSVVDVKNGFWHVQLDDESSKLTTFATPLRRFCCLQMPFGIAPVPEESNVDLMRYLNDLMESGSLQMTLLSLLLVTY